MKGALLDYIRAKVGQAIKSASTIIYTNPPSLTDLPDDGLVTKNMLVGYVPAAKQYAVQLTNVSGLIINWQTDLIDGVHTYVSVFGDIPPVPCVYLRDPTSHLLNPANALPVVDDGNNSGTINTVTFDWGYLTDGVIVF